MTAQLMATPMRKRPYNWLRGSPLVLFLAILVSAPSSAPAASPQALSLPTLIPSEKSPDDYLWVATSEVLDAAGDLVSDAALLLDGKKSAFLTDQWLRRAYEATRNGESPDRCVRHFPMTAGLAGAAPNTFEEIAAQARAVVRGTVVAAAGGFLYGSLTSGTMIEIRVTERRFGDPWYAGRDSLFIFVPGGGIPFGDTTICSHHGWPAPPRPGDEVLFLPGESSSPEHSTFPIIAVGLRGYELAYGRDGSIYAGGVLSRALARNAGRLQHAATLDELWIEATEAFARGTRR